MEISEDNFTLDSNSDCFDYETGEVNNNSKKRRIEQLELETTIQNSINDCFMDVNSMHETGESSSINQRIGDELEQFEVEMVIQRSTIE